METHPGKGNMKEKFPNSRKPSHRRVCGELGISEGNITRRRKKQNKTQNMCLTATASRKVVQMLTSATNEQGLEREEWAASLVLREKDQALRVKDHCPEDNLKELT